MICADKVLLSYNFIVGCGLKREKGDLSYNPTVLSFSCKAGCGLKPENLVPELKKLTFHSAVKLDVD